jgi:hypothetical protein
MTHWPTLAACSAAGLGPEKRKAMMPRHETDRTVPIAWEARTGRGQAQEAAALLEPAPQLAVCDPELVQLAERAVAAPDQLLIQTGELRNALAQRAMLGAYAPPQ